MRRPAQIAIASATLLIVAGIPFWGVKFISVDASVLPTTTSSRQVDDAHVSPFCVFHVEISSAFLNPTRTIAHKNRSLTVAVGRAPPAA